MKGVPFAFLAGAVACVALLAPTACLAQQSSTSTQATPANQRAARLYTPPVWFEEFASPAQISPDGNRALDIAGGIRVVDLTSGKVVPNPIWKGLDRVESAILGFRGDLLLVGQLGAEFGLFRNTGGSRPTRVPLPAGSQNPQWSPDGSKVAVTRPRSGDNTVFAGELERLQSYVMNGRPTALAWLPSSEAVLALVVDSAAMSSLVRIDLRTGQVRQLVENLDAGPRPQGLAVSSDGRRVYAALASVGKPSNAERNRASAARALGIFEIDLATGSRHVVVPPSRHGDSFAPMVAHGELYWTHSEIDAATVVLPVTGGTARPVILDALAPSWRPDGRQIGVVYGEWRMADWAINWDGGVVDVDRQGRRTSSLLPLLAGNGEDFPPIWSPDGRWIAFHSHRSLEPVPFYGAPGSSDDIWLRRAPTTSRDATEIRLTDFGWEVGSPDWSRDGTRLLFTSWERGKPGASHPWIVTIDTATGRPLGHAPLVLPPQIHGALWAAWSPVSDSIALEEEHGDGRHALWIVAADGSGARMVTEYAMLTYSGVCWTPDGKSLIYAARVGDLMQLFSISVAGGEPRQLTRDAGNVFHPRVSPDGKLIAATRLVHRREIWHRAMPR